MSRPRSVWAAKFVKQEGRSGIHSPHKVSEVGYPYKLPSGVSPLSGSSRGTKAGPKDSVPMASLPELQGVQLPRELGWMFSLGLLLHGLKGSRQVPGFSLESLCCCF